MNTQCNNCNSCNNSKPQHTSSYVIIIVLYILLAIILGTCLF